MEARAAEELVDKHTLLLVARAILLLHLPHKEHLDMLAIFPGEGEAVAEVNLASQEEILELEVTELKVQLQAQQPTMLVVEAAQHMVPLEDLEDKEAEDLGVVVKALLEQTASAEAEERVNDLELPQ
jgi:hypothetical protein